MKKVSIFAVLAAIMALILVFNIVGYCGAFGDDVNVSIGSLIFAAVITAGLTYLAISSYLKYRKSVSEINAAIQPELTEEEKEMLQRDDYKEVFPDVDISVLKDIIEHADVSDSHVKMQLAMMYLYGAKDAGIKRDHEKALKLIKEGVEKNEDFALFMYGWCYEVGFGVERDTRKGYEYYMRSAGMGLSFAQGALGTCYMRGLGVLANPVTAVYWFRKSAEQNNSLAMYNLGLCYKYGDGVAQDAITAKTWFQKAAELGCKDAIKELENFRT